MLPGLLDPHLAPAQSAVEAQRQVCTQAPS